jgi:hypothetical protein
MPKNALPSYSSIDERTLINEWAKESKTKPVQSTNLGEQVLVGEICLMVDPAKWDLIAMWQWYWLESRLAAAQAYGDFRPSPNKRSKSSVRGTTLACSMAA